MPQDKASLYYKDSGADKEYHASIEAKDGGHVVNFAFGRRGSTLQTGTKTQSPVSYDKAKSIFEKLVREKTAKGYSPGAAGTPYQHTSKEDRATDVLPQLLNPIEEDEMLRLKSDDGFWMQQKFDGRRCLIRKTAEGIEGINRKGLVVGLADPILQAAKAIGATFILDGEAIGDVFYAFDLLSMNGVDLRSSAYTHRLNQLEKLQPSGAIRLVETARTKKEKADLFAKLTKTEQEGVVFKRPSSLYVAGRPSNGGGSQLKFKFYATASCIVAGINAKRSVGLAVLDGDKLVNVGNVTIPPNQPIPVKDALLEVRYLYAYKGGSLFQPTSIGLRDDIDRSACSISQLKYKPEGGDEDA